MKIGIMKGSDIFKLSNPLNFCDKIVFIKEKSNESMLSIEKYINDMELEDTFYANSLVGLDSSLNELFPLFESLISNNKIIIFLNRPESQMLTDEQYFFLIWEMVKNENRITKEQRLVIQKGQVKRSKKIGRPTIANDKATKIKKLYKEEYKTIREIATICNVSLGTAFKYANK